MPSLVRLTENSLERSARLLAQQHNIRVVFKGNKAITDSDKGIIYLPSLPENAPEWYSAILHGFLEKQLAHLLFSSTKEVLPYLTDLLIVQCFSVVEDIRTSRKYETIYPGSVVDAKALDHFMYSMTRNTWVQTSPPQQVLTSAYYSEKYGPAELDQFGVNNFIKNWVLKCHELIEAEPLDTVQDAVDLSLKLAELLRPLEQKQPEREPPPTPPEDPQEEDKENKAGEEESEQEKKLKEQLFDSITSQEDHPSEDGASQDEFDVDNDTYRIFSTENDSIEDAILPEVIQGAVDLNELRQETQAYVVVMKQRLSTSLRSLTQARRTFNHEVGDLDTDALVSLCLKSSNTVFQQRVAALKLDVAVAIALDHSGSMQEGDPSKLWLATQSALTIGDVLAPLNIPFMVYGYSTHLHKQRPPEGDLTSFSRWGAHWIRTYCNFGKPWRDGAARLSTAPSNVQTHTYDGESVLYGIRRLLDRKEKRKILFVLSDGHPQPGHGNIKRCMSYLHRVVKSGTQAGVEIVGFGIQSTAVARYFPKHVILHKLSDIVEEPLAVLDKALRQNQGLK